MKCFTEIFNLVSFSHFYFHACFLSAYFPACITHHAFTCPVHLQWNIPQVSVLLPPYQRHNEFPVQVLPLVSHSDCKQPCHKVKNKSLISPFWFLFTLNTLIIIHKLSKFNIFSQIFLNTGRYKFWYLSENSNNLYHKLFQIQEKHAD